jgi:membrane-associated HD superfamily phosphohydrolase
MMADSVEAASHSLSKHTDESINELVDRIIDGQVADRAFEDSPLTFRDISNIKALFKEKLLSIYHVRVSYPELRKG